MTQTCSISIQTCGSIPDVFVRHYWQRDEFAMLTFSMTTVFLQIATSVHSQEPSTFDSVQYPHH